jgi:hypothetical protein
MVLLVLEIEGEYFGAVGQRRGEDGYRIGFDGGEAYRRVGGMEEAFGEFVPDTRSA